MATCLVCGKSIKDGRKYCSQKCYHRSPHKGRPPTKPRKPCLICGKPVPRVNQKFCSMKCFGESIKGKERPELRKRETKICPICGNAFEVGGRTGHRNKIYCSLKCQHIVQRKPLGNMVFNKRSAWWRELRIKMMKRDNYQCQFCGKKGARKELQIHRIIPTNIELNFEEANLITCCHRCHSMINIATQLGYQNNPEFDPHKLVLMVRVK